MQAIAKPGVDASAEEVGELGGVRATLDQKEVRSSLLSVVSESLHDGIHERALAVCTDSVEYCEDLLRDLASSSVAHDPLDEAPQGFARQLAGTVFAILVGAPVPAS